MNPDDDSFYSVKSGWGRCQKCGGRVDDDPTSGTIMLWLTGFSFIATLLFTFFINSRVGDFRDATKAHWKQIAAFAFMVFSWPMSLAFPSVWYTATQQVLKCEKCSSLFSYTDLGMKAKYNPKHFVILFLTFSIGGTLLLYFLDLIKK